VGALLGCTRIRPIRIEAHPHNHRVTILSQGIPTLISRGVPPQPIRNSNPVHNATYDKRACP